MKKVSFIVKVLLTLSVLGLFGAAYLPVKGQKNIISQIAVLPAPTVVPGEAVFQGPEAVIAKAVNANLASRSDIVAYTLYKPVIDSIQSSSTGDTALVFIKLRDPLTNELIPGEPGLAIASLIDAQHKENLSGWKITLFADADFAAVLQKVPAELLTSTVRDQYLPPKTILAPSAAASFGGYYLPWANGVTHRLSWGANHSSCPATCTYAFDFYDIVDKKFPLLASKGGTVYGARWDCVDRPETASTGGSCTNYIALEDKSTFPTTYQIYLHLSQNTIPDRLRVIGTAVNQGEFLGNVDNTGYSFGSHVHFMVVTNPYFAGGGYWWGYSVDITFRDVAINWDSATQGGRPCNAADIGYGKCTQWQVNYTSQMPVVDPPSGDLILPGNLYTVTTPTLQVGGYGTDKLGITRLSMIANYGSSWVEVGPAQTTTPFVYDLDLCSANIPNGAFDLALRTWNKAGNQSQSPLGVRHLIKSVQCSKAAPALVTVSCVPAANQVAIFSEPNFGGSCTLLLAGSYSAAGLSPVGDNNLASVRVGTDVQAQLFDGANYDGRVETFSSDSRNLADNRIGFRTVSSVKVGARAVSPAAPVISAPTGPAGASLTAVDSIIFLWNGAGATKYQAKLFDGSVADCTAAAGLRSSLGFSGVQTWSVGTLPAGTFTLCVQGRIADKANTPYYSTWARAAFSVIAASLTNGSAAALPYNADMETTGSTWTAAGLWRLGTDPTNANNHLWISNTGSDYSDAGFRTGDLTSGPVTLPAVGSAYLRFAYRYQTESAAPYWDQRRVQISEDGGKTFKDLYGPLAGDPMDKWLQSLPLSLAAYAGKTIQVRFHFDKVDLSYNSSLTGWMVDNMTITTTAPETCTESTANNTPAAAQAVNYGSSVSGAICPAGDVDYYKLNVLRGENVILDVDARTLTPVSALDSQLTVMIDPDTASTALENDDQQPGIQTDSYLNFIAPSDGIYYIRVRSASPGAGAAADRYTLKVSKGTASSTDTTDPVVTLSGSLGAGYLKGAAELISALAEDGTGGSGISRVEFWSHSTDWASGTWQLLGTDSSGTDGWNALLDASGLADGSLLAVYARAYDKAGNVGVSANWAEVVDKQPPVISLQPMSAAQDSTVISLSWSAKDARSGIGDVTLEYNRDGTGWQALSAPRPNAALVWFPGEWGHSYVFRARAADNTGWLSDYSQAGPVKPTLPCTTDAFDLGGGDNTAATASPLQLNTTTPHNICSPTGQNDHDWIKFSAVKGQVLGIWITPIADSPTAPAVKLYKLDGTTLLAQSVPQGMGQGGAIRWWVPADGTYLLDIYSSISGAGGTGLMYQVWVGVTKSFFFPLAIH